MRSRFIPCIFVLLSSLLRSFFSMLNPWPHGTQAEGRAHGRVRNWTWLDPLHELGSQQSTRNKWGQLGRWSKLGGLFESQPSHPTITLFPTAVYLRDCVFSCRATIMDRFCVVSAIFAGPTRGGRQLQPIICLWAHTQPLSWQQSAYRRATEVQN